MGLIVLEVEKVGDEGRTGSLSIKNMKFRLSVKEEKKSFQGRRG